jgi:hypothetical protein
MPEWDEEYSNEDGSDRGTLLDRNDLVDKDQPSARLMYRIAVLYEIARRFEAGCSRLLNSLFSHLRRYWPEMYNRRDMPSVQI